MIKNNFDSYFYILNYNKFIFPTSEQVQELINDKDKLESFFTNSKKSDKYIDIINSFLFELNLIFFKDDTYHEDNIIKCLDIYEDIYEYVKYDQEDIKIIESFEFFMTYVTLSKDNKNRPFFYLTNINIEDRSFNYCISNLKKAFKKSKNYIDITNYILFSSETTDIIIEWIIEYEDFQDEDKSIQNIMKKISDEIIGRINTKNKLYKYKEFKLLKYLIIYNKNFNKFIIDKIEDKNTCIIYLIKLITIYSKIMILNNLKLYFAGAEILTNRLDKMNINKQYYYNIFKSEIFFSSIEEDLQLLIIAFKLYFDTEKNKDKYTEQELKDILTKIEIEYKKEHGYLPKKENILPFYITKVEDTTVTTVSEN